MGDLLGPRDLGLLVVLREALEVRVELLHLLLVRERDPVLELRLLQLELALQEGDLGLGLAAQPAVDLGERRVLEWSIVDSLQP